MSGYNPYDPFQKMLGIGGSLDPKPITGDASNSVSPPESPASASNPYDPINGPFTLRQPDANPDAEVEEVRSVPSVLDAMQSPFGLAASMETGKPDRGNSAAAASRTPVDFPRHLYIPENAESLDLRRLGQVSSGTNGELFIKFKCPVGSLVRIIGYGVFCDGANENDFSFLPEIDGKRILPYHGNPMNNYRISLGLAPDLSNNSIIGCQIVLQPGQELTWKVTNSSAVAAAMGVRLVGYFDASEQTSTPKFS